MIMVPTHDQDCPMQFRYERNTHSMLSVEGRELGKGGGAELKESREEQTIGDLHRSIRRWGNGLKFNFNSLKI